uniref:Uncharacterized protein n=1 Tax=Oryza rufipogon TaxID=4529 RepID=A0A0E0RKC2_ORYRU
MDHIVSVGASAVPAGQPHAGAAGEAHADVVPVDHRQKSRLPPDVPSVNSASVSGGCPDSLHDSAPPQSPVAHLPRPAPSKLHPVRPHTLPELVPAGTLMVHVCPGFSCVPPPTGVAAGHTVNEQRLVMVKVAALAPPAARLATRTTTRSTAEEAAGADAIVKYEQVERSKLGLLGESNQPIPTELGTIEMKSPAHKGSEITISGPSQKGKCIGR